MSTQRPDPPPWHPGTFFQVSYTTDRIRVWSDGNRRVSEVVELLRMTADAFEGGAVVMESQSQHSLPRPRQPGSPIRRDADE